MAEKTPAVTPVIQRDRVHLEFLIEDLMKELAISQRVAAPNCNGCNHCASAADLPSAEKGK